MQRDLEKNKFNMEGKTVENKLCGLHSFQTFMQKKGWGLHLYSKRVPTPPSAWFPLSLLCTLKAQVEAGVSQLDTYSFLSFILLHTYLTSMNGALLTPFNSHSKQALLAQLMCNN